MESIIGKENSEQSPPLLDSFMEDVGGVKIEIQRVRSRIAVVSGFYQHIRNTESALMRRELEEKVNAEIDIISLSLSNIIDTFPRWSTILELSNGVQKMQRIDMERGVKEFLRQVLAEYEKVLNDHRDACLQNLQRMLKVTKMDDYLEKGGAYGVDQAHLISLTEHKHIEIEERYGELLRIDRHLRYLKTKFANFLSSGEFTDLAVLHLSRVMDFRHQHHQPSFAWKTKMLFLLTSLSSLSLILIIFYLLL